MASGRTVEAPAFQFVRPRWPGGEPVLADVTPTAGGLVFAADLAGNLFPLDAASGCGPKTWDNCSGEGSSPTAARNMLQRPLAMAVAPGQSTWSGGASWIMGCHSVALLGGACREA